MPRLTGNKQPLFGMRVVVASCSTTASPRAVSVYGKVCAPQVGADQQRVALRVVVRACAPFMRTSPR